MYIYKSNRVYSVLYSNERHKRASRVTANPLIRHKAKWIRNVTRIKERAVTPRQSRVSRSRLAGRLPLNSLVVFSSVKYRVSSFAYIFTGSQPPGGRRRLSRIKLVSAAWHRLNLSLIRYLYRNFRFSGKVQNLTPTPQRVRWRFQFKLGTS